MADAVYFYADVDDYPINYITELIDTNGILVIDASNPKYTVAQGVFGTYYVRIRP